MQLVRLAATFQPTPA